MVDDEEDILDVIEEMLKSNNPPIQVDTFTDPERALKHFRDKREGYYSVVLSDVRMPRMSGFVFAREIRNLSHKVKIIMMSAFEMNKNEFDSVWPMLHISEFVSKPFTRDQLVRAVTKYMDMGDTSATAGKDDESMYLS
ncbi:response regulator [Candidatus Nitrososphaera evergladensis]|uniref:response regulator n=1 Tax=Candidatus Nitrososphaera evergladensis TaxID=1459637 RepID=UPI00130D5A2E|nr:response regulator [Candidatus Nitrososphaera evergladensis]